MKEKLILDLYNKKCIQFGEFKLKSGKTSPIYINLKNVISHPYILNTIVELIFRKTEFKEYTHIMGIPYGGIPFASVLSSKYNIPMIMIRKETKKYGLKKLIEGEYTSDSKIIIIEDTVSTGSSLKHFITQLEKINLKPQAIIAVCDRRKEAGLLGDYDVLSIITMNDIVSVLYKNKLIEHNIYRELYNGKKTIATKPFITNNIMLNKLLEIIKTKETMYCYVIEYTNYESIIDFIHKYHKRFCILKLFSVTIEHFSYEKAKHIKELSIEYNFLIYEGYNFNTSKTIFLNEITLNNKYYEWVDIINISFRHEDEVFNSINYINTCYNKNMSVVYESIEDSSKIKHLLKNIIIGTTMIKFKNIFTIGTKKSDILLFKNIND